MIDLDATLVTAHSGSHRAQRFHVLKNLICLGMTLLVRRLGDRLRPLAHVEPGGLYQRAADRG